MDFNSILQQAQMMKDNLGKLSEELDERTYTGNNGGKDGVMHSTLDRSKLVQCLVQTVSLNTTA